MATVDSNVNIAKTNSKTVTDTIAGEHTHTIVGYSLVKGIGDGEPMASERFTVGGHEWVLLFYPDGKRSSTSEGPGPMDHAFIPANPGIFMQPHPAPPAPAIAAAAAADGHADHPAGRENAAPAPAQPPNDRQAAPVPAAAPAAPAAAAAAGAAAALPAIHHHPLPAGMQRVVRRDTSNEYAALFVALIGEGPNPQGVVNTSEGKVVRAFHRFTLVDQTGQGRDLTKGRTRDAGAVKISCARQDPNARNCHGYRKFVKRTMLEDPARGFLVRDTIIIKYTIELVVTSGGALSRSKADLMVPPPSLGADLQGLLTSQHNADFTFVVEGEKIKAHKLILETRSEVFAALFNSNMKEVKDGKSTIHDIKPEVFRALLHFVYCDSLPEEHDGQNLDAAMAQHLLMAADQYRIVRLRRICERRLCETVDVETVATTLTLAEQNHADELKKVCLDFCAKHLAAVITTDGYRYMLAQCPELQGELLAVMAQSGGAAHYDRHRQHAVRPREHTQEDEPRRLRARRGE